MIMSHDFDPRSNTVSWVSSKLMSEENSVLHPNFEKLLGFAPSPEVAGMDNKGNALALNFQSHIEDCITELMEEDVWGHDDDMTLFDDSLTPSLKQWLDSESDSNFWSLPDEVLVGSRSRFAGFLSPSQFSPIAINNREAMRGQPIYSLHIRTTQFGATSTIKNVQHIKCEHHDMLPSNEDFSPGNMPRSAPIEVPLRSRLCAQLDDSDDDNFSDNGRVPPHELLAEQFARSQVSTFSVIEGAGRTLKGRDASEVRDAVWKQTGFSG